MMMNFEPVGSFRSVDDKCFRPGQEGMMMNFEPVRSFQNYGEMVSRKVKQNWTMYKDIYLIHFYFMIMNVAGQDETDGCWWEWYPGK